MTASPDQADNACPNCGQPGMAAYCDQCGEKRRDRTDWNLRTLPPRPLPRSRTSSTPSSGKPSGFSFLSRVTSHASTWNGRRKRFLGPVKLYLVFFALSLVLYSIHWPTAIYDVRTFTAADPTGWLSRFLDELANTRGMSASQFAQEVNSRWQSYISMSQVIYPLFVALALMLLFRRRGPYFAEHLIFALHVLAFTFLISALLWPAFALFGLRTSTETFTAPLS